MNTSCVRITDKNYIERLLFDFRESLFDISISEEKLVELSDKYSKYGMFILLRGIDDLGFIVIYANDYDRQEAFISMLVVKSSYQGQGYGKKLIEEAETIAKACGMTRVRLVVDSNNNKAIDFYEKNDYYKVENDGKKFFYEKILKVS